MIVIPKYMKPFFHLLFHFTTIVISTRSLFLYSYIILLRTIVTIQVHIFWYIYFVHILRTYISIHMFRYTCFSTYISVHMHIFQYTCFGIIFQYIYIFRYTYFCAHLWCTYFGTYILVDILRYTYFSTYI